MQYPHHDDRAPETELARYLQQATEILDAAGTVDPQAGADPLPGLTRDFEDLRWFDLPAASLSTTDTRF